MEILLDLREALLMGCSRAEEDPGIGSLKLEALLRFMTK